MKRNSKGGVAGDRFFCALEARRLLSSAADSGTSGWADGGFDYDGKINVDDYGIIDFNVGIQGAPFQGGSSVPPAVETSDTFTVDGTAKADRIVVTFNGVSLTGIVNGWPQSVDASGITNIVVRGARGNDTIVVDPTVTLPTRIYGDAGDDTITGGSGPDRIIAGDGNDVVSAGDAKDTVYGEAGDDYIRGAGGSDHLEGGDGRDTILADSGNDHVYGDANPDNLRGGAGNDDLHGGGGGDALHGEAGDDFLAGDKAADHLFPGTGDNLCDAHDDDFILDGGLTTSGGAVIKLTADSNYIVGNVTDGASLDLADNTMIIDGQSVVPRVSGLIQSGRNGGSWDGSLGIATAQQVAGAFTMPNDSAVWAGQTVSGSDTLVMYTYGGDANLDGKISVDDYAKIDMNIPTGSSGWFNGDFNYDGKINVDDYGVIDINIPGATTPKQP